MDAVLGVIAWIKANWAQIVQVITGIVTVASIIVKFTPTLKDDNFLLGVIKFLSKYVALNRTVDDNAVRSGTK